MDNFNEEHLGYRKQEVNEFVDYVIKKTEENISTIKSQKDEILRLTNELEEYKRLYLTNFKINNPSYLSEKEADLIIKEAKDNASRIVNDALLKAEKVENQKELLNKSIKMYKKKIRSTLMEQLDILEDIEIL